MKRASIPWIGGAVLLAVLALRTPVAGQTTNQDTLTALLVEVRGLRAAMEQMAVAGPRVQLAFGRLQLQEQRVSAVVRRADALHDAVVTAQKRVSELQDRVADLQRALENIVDPKLRSDIESELPHTKGELGRAAADLQRLQTEELDAANQVANEQARWAEINQLLESLERTLAR
jgi:chromosome segregation ATPase